MCDDYNENEKRLMKMLNPKMYERLYPEEVKEPEPEPEPETKKEEEPAAE